MKKFLICLLCAATFFCGCANSDITEYEMTESATIGNDTHWAGDEDGDTVEYILANKAMEHLAGDEDGDASEYILEIYELGISQSICAAKDAEEDEEDGTASRSTNPDTSTTESVSASTETETTVSSASSSKSTGKTTGTETKTTKSSAETATTCSHSYTYTYTYNGESCIKTGTCSKCMETTSSTSSHSYTVKTKTVHHDAVTEDVTATYVVCSQCGEVLGTASSSSQAANLCNYHIATTTNPCASWTYKYEVVGTVIVTEAYDETVTYYVCTNCGYTKE